MNNMCNSSEIFKLFDLQKHSSEVKFDLSNTQYEYVDNIGTGAYGIVCQAKNRILNQDYAIKKIKNPFNHKVTLIRTIREIRILNNFNHTNIINIVDIFLKDYNDIKDIYVVFDLMESDLHKIITSKQTLTDDHIRYFMYQLLCGVNYIHSASVIHRDLKPANILVNSNCHLKIADFGMARLLATPIKSDALFSQDVINFNMTQYVMTRWYRAPELLMGQLSYNTKIDLWSCGCILAELYLKRPLFRGDNMINQLKEIIQKMGTPNNQFRMKVLPIVNSLINAEGELKPIPLSNLVPASKKVIDLLSHLLVYDPDQRWSAIQTLKHIFFLKYKNPSKEEICKTIPDLSFEIKLNSVDLLKEALLTDILSKKMKYNYFDQSNRSKRLNSETLNLNKIQSGNCEIQICHQSESPTSERTLSADSGKGLGHPITYFEVKDLLPTSNNLPDISDDNRLKTVSQFTKNKIINSIRNAKNNSNKTIVTAAQRQKERKDRKLKLKNKRDKKIHSKNNVSKSNIYQDQLSDLDKNFLKKWEHLTTCNGKAYKVVGEPTDNLSSNKVIDTSFTNDLVTPNSNQVDEMSAGLSALLLLEDIFECDKNKNLLKLDTNSLSKETIPDNNFILSANSFDLLFDLDLDCIDLDLNVLESYSCDLFKDEFIKE